MVGSFLYFCLLIIITLVKISARENLAKCHTLWAQQKTHGSQFTVPYAFALIICGDFILQNNSAEFTHLAIHGILSCASAHGYSVLLRTSNGSLEQEHKNISALSEFHVDGIISVSAPPAREPPAPWWIGTRWKPIFGGRSRNF